MTYTDKSYTSTSYNITMISYCAPVKTLSKRIRVGIVVLFDGIFVLSPHRTVLVLRHPRDINTGLVVNNRIRLNEYNNIIQ